MYNRKIGIVTFPLGKSNIIPLYNLISITRCLTNHVYIITGNAGINVAQKLNDLHFELIYHTSGSNIITKVYNYAKTQLTITIHMLKLSKNIDSWIFPIGGEALISCIIFAKILRKSVIMSLTSSTESMMKYQSDFLSPIVVLFAKINCFFATRIILYSPTLVTEWNLEKYRHKILIAHRHFLDFNTFTVTTPLPDRAPLIGYIGRLSGEKGVQHFAQALPAILNDRQDLRVLIGGDGQLKETIEASLEAEGVTARVDLPGWISHDDLPNYLNQLRLLVLPSYTEGLPNIMLEAMACGRPVIASDLPGVRTVVDDGVNGFLVRPRDCDDLATKMRLLLENNEMRVTFGRAGRKKVEEKYSWENIGKALERLYLEEAV